MWVPASWNVRGGPPGGRLAWAARRAAGRGRGPPSCLEGPHAGPARSFGRKPGLGGGRVLGAARPPLGSRYLVSIAGQGREGGRRAAVAAGVWRVRGRRSRACPLWCSGQRQLHARRARTGHTRSPYHGSSVRNFSSPYLRVIAVSASTVGHFGAVTRTTSVGAHGAAIAFVCSAGRLNPGGYPGGLPWRGEMRG